MTDKNLTAHSLAALEIVKKIFDASGRDLTNFGEVMMMLETVNATTLLAIFGEDQLKAQSALDALHEGTSRRLMVHEGKPRI